MDRPEQYSPPTPPQSFYQRTDSTQSVQSAETSSSHDTTSTSARVKRKDGPSTSSEMGSQPKKKRKKDKSLKHRTATQVHPVSPAQTQVTERLPPIVYMSKNRVLEFTDQCNRYWREAVAEKNAEIQFLRATNSDLHEELHSLAEENRSLRARLAYYEGNESSDRSRSPSPFPPEGLT